MRNIGRSVTTAALALLLAISACGPSVPPQTPEETRKAAAEAAKVEAEARMDAIDKKEQAAKSAPEKPQ